MKLSIVTTLYQSETHIVEFCERAAATASKLVGDNFEVILVNDGATDNSLEVSLSLLQKFQNLTVIDLSRNFGHHQAMLTGLEHAKGDLVYLIDSDLEESPEWLIDFNDALQNQSCDVVFGVQKKRRGGMLTRFQGGLFYKLFRFLTKVDQPDNIVTARIMTKRYVDALLLHSESEINIGGLWVITGFKQHPVEVAKQNSSSTTYPLSKKVGHFVNAVTSFSSAPLVFIFYTGLMIFILAAMYVANLVINFYFFERPLDGYTSLIASTWLLSGLIILFMGILGIYLSKIFTEVKNRPRSIVRHIYKAGEYRENS